MKNNSNQSYLSVLVALLLFVGTHSSFAQDTTAAVHVGFIYPLSSNGKNAASYTNHFSLHAIAGLSKNETGCALASVANVILEDAQGVQIAGLVNLIGGTARGSQIAGVANLVGETAYGTMISGFTNVAKGETMGAQLAGFMNLATGVGALQVAGFTNIAKEDVKGLQLAGFLNTAQNVTTQVSGFANIAQNVKGVQLAGFINIAENSDYPIALLNFIKNGEKSVALTIDETMTGMASFRSGGRVLYGIVGVGFNFDKGKGDLYAVEAGLGGHIPVRQNVRINLEAMSTTLSDFQKRNYFRNSLRILPAYRLGSKIEIFAGPTLNYVNYDQEDHFDFIKNYIWQKGHSENFQGVYLGVNAGLQFLF